MKSKLLWLIVAIILGYALYLSMASRDCLEIDPHARQEIESEASINSGTTVSDLCFNTRCPARIHINKMLAELRAERQQLSEAILIFERLAVGRGRCPGPSAGLDYGAETARQAARKQEQAEGCLIRTSPGSDVERTYFVRTIMEALLTLH